MTYTLKIIRKNGEEIEVPKFNDASVAESDCAWFVSIGSPAVVAIDDETGEVIASATSPKDWKRVAIEYALKLYSEGSTTPGSVLMDLAAQLETGQRPAFGVFLPYSFRQVYPEMKLVSDAEILDVIRGS